MHAYLIVGNSPKIIQEKIDQLAEKLKAQTIKFPFAKIEDAKTLASFTKLAVTRPTAIILAAVENATTETLNAFLKNLEEAPQNLYYFLTAKSLSRVLPTITSRCQIIKIVNSKQLIVNSQLGEFLEKGIGEKFSVIDKIREREEAQTFVENLVYHLHDKLVNQTNNLAKIAQNLGIIQLTAERIRANGNIQLQLTNMVVNLV